MAAILGPGGPSTATYFAADGPGGPLFWGDHLWHDSQQDYIMHVLVTCTPVNITMGRYRDVLMCCDA